MFFEKKIKQTHIKVCQKQKRTKNKILETKTK